MKMIRVIQYASSIRTTRHQRRILAGLGLKGKINRSRVLPDVPSVRGMINLLPHLVKVVEE